MFWAGAHSASKLHKPTHTRLIKYHSPRADKLPKAVSPISRSFCGIVELLPALGLCGLNSELA